MSNSNPDLPAALAAIVGDINVLTDDSQTAAFLSDWRGAFSGRAHAVVRPASTAEVANVVRTCVAARVPIVPQGGNTGMCGGAVPDASGTAVVVALGRMNRILQIDPRNNTMVVEAGCVLARVQEAAAAADRLFPLSLAAEGSCQIGGNLATNAGGINVLRYGNARDLVLGIEAVLPDGSVLDALRALRKDNRGYDLKQLFVGAEGTLGIITKAVLKLYPRPAERMTALVAVDQPDAALHLLSRLRDRCGESLSAFELIGRACLDVVFEHAPGMRDPFAQRHPWYVLLDLGGARTDAQMRATLEEVLAEEAEQRHLADAVVAQTVAQANDLWRLREGIPEATRVAGPALRSDIAVALNDIPAFIARASGMIGERVRDARVICFGHLGDGNLHFNVLPSEGPRAAPDWSRGLHHALYEIVDDMNGSFSAEHGIGQAKREELARYKSGVELELMRTVKRALDPMNLMNPGKVL